MIVLTRPEQTSAVDFIALSGTGRVSNDLVITGGGFAMSACTIEGCNGAILARGWCQRHYDRWYAHGDPLAGGPRRIVGDVEARFYANVYVGVAPSSRLELGPCWIWTGACADNGYGVFNIGGRNRGAHRVSYELGVGPIPAGLTIDHLCVVRFCVNTSHLEPVTQAENSRRAAASEACGNGHPWTDENTYIRPDQGTRQCRHCAAERKRGLR